VTHQKSRPPANHQREAGFVSQNARENRKSNNPRHRDTGFQPVLATEE
jgi:hypothetical protein